MKKILLSLAGALLLAVGAQAQVSYGVKAGLNLPKLKFSGDDSNTSYTSDMATNFHITGYANIFAAQIFTVQPGLSLQGKGGKFKSDNFLDLEEGEEGTVNFMSIEIPVNAVYYIPTGDVGSVFIGAGPYLGINVAANAKSGNVSEKLELGSGEEQIKRLDYGANFLAGYKLSNGLLLNVGYGLGLGNLLNVDAVKMKNQVLSIGVG